MKKLIKKILTTDPFTQKPPVLIDIGASDGTPEIWNTIKKFSICLAFDADDREMKCTISENKEYQKMYLFNRVVAPKASASTDFYLTNSPFCSSALDPDNNSLEKWLFSSYFEVKSKIKLPSITINEALKEVGIDYIDWYKADTQGTDLRLFDSIDDNIKNNIITAEFEPGIIDAYKKEDKLFQILQYFNNKSFWLENLKIKGTQRISPENAEQIFTKQEILNLINIAPQSPCWGEMRFFRAESALMSKRDFMLAWIFSILTKNYLYSFQLALLGKQQAPDKLFDEMLNISKKKSRSTLSLKYYFKYKLKNAVMKFC